MKKTILLVCVALILASLVLVACGGGSTPTTAVKGFLSALEKNDTDAMKKYATDETVQMMAAFSSKIEPELKKYGKATNFKETINGDTAKVEVTFASGDTSEFDLAKVDGQWKVAFKK